MPAKTRTKTKTAKQSAPPRSSEPSSASGLSITYRSVSELIPYVNNARTHSDEQIARIASSIKEFGFTNPILIDGDNGIIAGHGRVAAARKLGLDTVPTIELSHLSPVQKKAYILADNRLALDAGWDSDLLKLEIEELRQAGYDLGLTGFQSTEIDDILGLVPDEPNPYTDRIDVPQYEIAGTSPKLSACLDTEKTQSLLEEIERSAVSSEEKDFLRKAAYRHTAFNYANVAEYYVNASKEMQRLMEASALVIIDFDNAMRDGFVRLSKDLKHEAGLDTNDEDKNP